jgi:hypothetical protein
VRSERLAVKGLATKESFQSNFPLEVASHPMSGDDGGGDTRVPISNTAVKPSSADGTWTEGSRESRTLPGKTHSDVGCLFLDSSVGRALGC